MEVLGQGCLSSALPWKRWTLYGLHSIYAFAYVKNQQELMSWAGKFEEIWKMGSQSCSCYEFITILAPVPKFSQRHKNLHMILREVRSVDIWLTHKHMLYCLRGILSFSFQSLLFHSCQLAFLRTLLWNTTSCCCFKVTTIENFPEKSCTTIRCDHKIIVTGTLSELSQGSFSSKGSLRWCSCTQKHSSDPLGFQWAAPASPSPLPSLCLQQLYRLSYFGNFVQLNSVNFLEEQN